MKNRSDWWEDAACKGLDPNIWFPERPQGRDYFAIARGYCQMCPVIDACLAEALLLATEDDRFGMFGGHTPKERARLREGKPAAKPQTIKPVPTRAQTQPKRASKQLELPLDVEVSPPGRYVARFLELNQPIWEEIALKRKKTPLEDTKIPKQTQLVMNLTQNIEPSQVTAQALAAMIMAGWEDPLGARTAAALFMGASYVGELASRGVEAGVITPQENAAVQGVVDIAMRVWKHHATHAKMGS